MRSVHIGWSKTYQPDPASSSGGVVRELIAQALASGDPVVCLARDPRKGRLEPRLLLRVSELAYVPGSVYHSVSFVNTLDLIRRAPGPAVLVAVPCQLAGVLQSIAEVGPSLAAKLKLVVGIVCGWMYSQHALHAFCRFNGIHNPVIDSTTYRGGADRIGKLMIRTDSECFSFRRTEIPTLGDAINYQSSFSKDLNRLRCRVCEDHLNLSADLIAGDAWLDRKATEKVSIIGCRTIRGEEALLGLERRGLVRLERAEFGDFLESQSHGLVYGEEARTINEVLRNKGHVMPRFRFKDIKSRPWPTFRQRESVRWELMRRHIVQRGAYSLYRLTYIVRRPRLVLRYVLKRLLRRMR
jgi:coenzyme F420-reducing hydrogenase beta subunit